MQQPLSPDFISSFVETCYDAGLSKESTAELLQVESIRRHGQDHPGFFEGYKSVCGLPSLSADDFRKSSSFARVGGALKSILRHPGSLAGGGAIAGGALTALWPKGDTTQRPTAPYLPPGGYDPARAKSQYAALLDSHSAGIAELNSRYNQSNTKRDMLEGAAAAGGVGSYMAGRDLKQMDAERAEAEKQRAAFTDNLRSQGASVQSQLATLQRQRALASGAAKPTWGERFKSLFSSKESPDSQARRFEELSTMAQLIKDQQRRLTEGYTGGAPRRDNAQIQRDFFPTE